MATRVMNGHTSPWASSTPRTPRRGGGWPPMTREEDTAELGTPQWSPRTPRRGGGSPPMTREVDTAGLGTPQRPPPTRGEREDLPAGFATPRRMGRQRSELEFRTPQHPSMGSNNWGGASPLLARNIPRESLEAKYLRLNTLRTRDEIFPVEEWDLPPAAAPPAKAHRGGAGWLFSKLGRKGRKAKVVITMGAPHRKKSSWLPAFDYRGRWPQGW